MTAPDRLNVEAIEATLLHYVPIGRFDGPALCGITGNWDPKAAAGTISLGPRPVCPLCGLVRSGLQP